MVGQKTRIIKRFEREAKKKLEKDNLDNSYINCIKFSFQEIKNIINWKDKIELNQKKKDESK